MDLDLSRLGLTHFLHALTQLTALKCLDASGNNFAQLPAGITALSRLTVLTLGRRASPNDMLQLHEKRPLNVVALGDLSGFPALRELTLTFCEVVLCMSLPCGAVQHTCLALIYFYNAHPAPECALMVLLLSRALKRTGRGSVVCRVLNFPVNNPLELAQERAPCYKFMAALEACEP